MIVSGTKRVTDAKTVATRKVAWVTGASSGIGKALALRLARDGWLVAASARNPDTLRELERQAPGSIRSFPVDVTDHEAVRVLSRSIRDTLGPIDLAIFSAGTYWRDSAVKFDSDKLGEMMNLNVMGTARCLEAVLPDMIARRTGQICVIASVAGYNGLPGAAFYGATKAALNTMCEGLYPELEEQGVLLSVANPGFVETPLTAKNDFSMPFMITAEKAAEEILRGLAARKFEIVFPFRMAVAMKLMHALPQRLRFAITRRMLRADRKAAG